MYGCWWNMASRQKVTAYSVSTLPLAGRNSANMCSERGPVGFLGKKKKCGFYAMWTRPVKTNKRDIEQWFSTDESHPKSGLEPFSLALWAISLFFFLQKRCYNILKYRENARHLLLQETQFNSMISIIYILAMIESGRVFLFLWCGINSGCDFMIRKKK